MVAGIITSDISNETGEIGRECEHGADQIGDRAFEYTALYWGQGWEGWEGIPLAKVFGAWALGWGDGGV